MDTIALPDAYSGLLLDCDGVLVDSHGQSRAAFKQWVKDVDADITIDEGSGTGRRVSEMMSTVFDIDRAAIEARRLVGIEVSLASGTRPCEGAAKLLEEVEGRIPWAVVTSADREVAEARLVAAGLPVPKVLVAAGDVTRGKPEPECYMKAAGELGLSPHQCLAIDDLEIGCRAAVQAGSLTVRLTSEASTDKYQARTLRDVKLTLHGAPVTFSVAIRRVK